MIRFLKYGSIGKSDVVVIILALAAVLLICVVSACDNKAKGRGNTIVSTDYYKIDTLTLMGHKYLVVNAGIGNVRLQHEESCKIEDMRFMLNNDVKVKVLNGE